MNPTNRALQGLALFLAMTLFVGFVLMAVSSFGATPPAAWTLQGVASYSQPLIRSYPSLPAVATFSFGDLIMLTTDPPSMWRDTDIGAGVASLVQISGAGDGASSAELSAHVASQTDPHGASMTISQDVRVGTGPFDVRVGRIATGVLSIASAACFVPPDVAPDTTATGTVFYASSAAHLRLMKNGAYSSVVDTPADLLWEDMVISAAGINLSGAPAAPSVDTTQDYGALTFAGTGDHDCAFSLQMPHRWKNETAIVPHFHCRAFHADAVATATFELHYKIATPGGSYPAAYTVATASFQISATDTHKICEFPNMTMTGAQDSAVVICLLRRVGDAASDTATASVNVHSIDFHYQVDIHKDGSVAEDGDAQ